MRRTTVDFGIHLGTEHSAIAVLQGTNPKMIQNSEGLFRTPSAVWIDARGRIYVGVRAYQRLASDVDNAYGEFKLQMGTDRVYTFVASGRQMKPEELSAEVLKSLRADVQQRTGEVVRAAVVTVPAVFDLPQCEATRRAAELAGIELSPLLQEPIAAGLAYGFQSESESAFWMVYDLGGGTFDAAVLHLRDGQLRVANHGGDNHLGGKLIDWEIVEKLLVPELTRQYRLSDFRRGNPRWRGAFAKLKQQAEVAKIHLSRDEVAPVYIDPLCHDDGGQWVKLDTEIQRGDVDGLMAPYIERSVNICKKVLAEENLTPRDVERLILVGGPTLMPVLRHMLSERLGIPLEFGVDPLTVVAQGAAIFAGTRRLPVEWQSPPEAGQFAVELEYQPVSDNPEPWVGGTVRGGEGQSIAGFTVELVEQTSEWRSGRLRLSDKGTFSTAVHVEKGRDNWFLIELCDPSGRLRETIPDRLGPIRMSWPPSLLLDSIGMVLPGDKVGLLLPRGTPLPARRREKLQTTVPLRRGESGSLLRIPVVEGEHSHRADRNRLVGYLEVTCEDVDRDVPAGSEVEITVEVDESRQLTATAYVPGLDGWFDEVITLGKDLPDLVQLALEVDREKERLAQILRRQEEVPDPDAKVVLDRIETEQMGDQVETALNAAADDPDAADKCKNRLLDLQVALDEAENALATAWARVGRRQRHALAVQPSDEIAPSGQMVEETKMITRTTVDFGVDLGTTNSVVAVLGENGPKVIQNPESLFWTPSAVWIDARGRIYCGVRAYQRLVSDVENAYGEFKLQMGTDRVYTFAASGQQMKPEELSAEVLKSLRADVQQRTGEVVRAAVVTVPAVFDLPQCEATRRAAELAGIELSPLLQEPIAAGLAYGFQSESESAFWMVYDLGGGTFDAAVLHLRDGQLRVANHGGDNHLGGKLIDWEIVEKLLVPELTRQYRLSDFRRGNPRWRGAFAKLKQQAEVAKIHLSRDEVAPVYIDPLCHDDGGQWVKLDTEIQRGDVDGLMAPYIERSVNICKKVLAEENLTPRDVERLILVGGPTLMPVLRHMLSERLGIPLEFGVDPLTVVAQGAAIFAGTRRLPVEWQSPPEAGQFAVELEYQPVSDNPEPWVGGTVRGGEGQSIAGFTVELVEQTSEWRSGRLRLSDKGTFSTAVHVEKGRDNWFLIELCDPSGRLRETIPDRLGPIRMSWPPSLLLDSIGMVLPGDKVGLLLPRGTPLPARRREKLQTTVPLRRGESGSLLRIPVVEGEHSHRADRNRLVGYLDISGSQVRRDVPAGSQVEIAVEIDESRQVTTYAYVKILDQEYDKVMGLVKDLPDPVQLAPEVGREMERLAQILRRQEEVRDPDAKVVLDRIEAEQMVDQVETALNAAADDPDAADKCQNRLLDLQIALDEAEDILEWPGLIAEAERLLKMCRQVVNGLGSPEERSRLGVLETEMREGVRAHEPDLVRDKLIEIEGLRLAIVLRQPGAWRKLFNELVQYKSRMRDQQRAEQLISQGYAAIHSNDENRLRQISLELWPLLSPEDRKRIESGVDRVP